MLDFFDIHLQPGWQKWLVGWAVLVGVGWIFWIDYGVVVAVVKYELSAVWLE